MQGHKESCARCRRKTLKVLPTHCQHCCDSPLHPQAESVVLTQNASCAFHQLASHYSSVAKEQILHTRILIKLQIIYSQNKPTACCYVLFSIQLLPCSSAVLWTPTLSVLPSLPEAVLNFFPVTFLNKHLLFLREQWLNSLMRAFTFLIQNASLQLTKGNAVV